MRVQLWNFWRHKLYRYRYNRNGLYGFHRGKFSWNSKLELARVNVYFSWFIQLNYDIFLFNSAFVHFFKFFNLILGFLCLNLPSIRLVLKSCPPSKNAIFLFLLSSSDYDYFCEFPTWFPDNLWSIHFRSDLW